MSRADKNFRAAPRSAKDWSEDDSGAVGLSGRRASETAKKTKRLQRAIQNINTRRTRRATRLQEAQQQIERESDASEALSLQHSDSSEYQEQSHSNASESSDSGAEEHPAAKPQRRSTRLRTRSSTRAGQAANRRRTSRAPPPPVSPENSNLDEGIEDHPKQKPASRRTRGGPASIRVRRGATAPSPSSPEDSTSEEVEEEPPKQRSAPRRTKRQSGRRPLKLIQGDAALSSDEDADDDIDNFIVDSDQESEEAGAVSDGEEGEGADGKGPDSGAQQRAPKRRRLRKAEPEEPEPERPDLEDSDSDEETRAARSARLKGKQPAEPEVLDDDEPGSSAMHARRAVGRAPAREAGREGVPPAVLEEKRTAEELGGKQAVHAGKRRRLHKAGGNAVTPEGGAATGAVSAKMRTRTLSSRPSAIDRLLQHQAAYSLGTARQDAGGNKDELVDGDDGMHDYISPDDDEEGLAGVFVVPDDDEEQGQTGDGSESIASLSDFIERDGPEDGTGVEVASPLEGLGLPYQRPELKDSFFVYLDYLLYSLADPDFQDKLEADQTKRREYLRAVKRIEEEELATWREHHAKSDAWKRATPGFVPALERLPGLSWGEGHYEGEGDDEGEVRECAACERLHSHATVELTFKGRPYWPDYEYGTKSLAGMAIRADDVDPYLEEEDGERQERSYVVGPHCAVRVQLYHALWHFKRRVRGKLKKKLKESRIWLQRAGKPSSWMDAADNATKAEGLYKRLFYIFQGLKWAAPVYSQGSTGGGFSRASESVRRKSEKVTKLLYNLNSDSEGDEGSDLVFSDDSVGDSDHDGSSNDGRNAEENGNISGSEEGASQAEDDPATAEDHGAEYEDDHEPQEAATNDDHIPGSRQLNSQPVRRRLVLDSDESDADGDADDIITEAGIVDSHAAISAAPPGASSAGPSGTNPAPAGGFGGGASAGPAAAPVAQLAAQSMAGVQAALGRATAGGSARSGSSGGARPGTSGGRNSVGGRNMGSSTPGHVKRQKGILAYFSPRAGS